MGVGIRDPLLITARPLSGELPNPAEFKFRLRDSGGRIAWEANARRHRFPDRGFVFVAENAVMPESLSASIYGSLWLGLKWNEQPIAQLAFVLNGLDQALEPPNRPDESSQNAELLEACEEAIAEWSQLSDKEAGADQEIADLEATLGS